MMITLRTLCLFLLFLLLLHMAKADQIPSTTITDSLNSKDQNGSPTSTMEPNLTATYHQNPTDTNNTSGGDCLIDTEIGLIAIGSAGGLIICLLVTTSVLACQICVLQRRIYIPRSRRSNTEIMSADYWGTDQTEIEGLVGPCDTTVMLEEVTTDSRTRTEIQGAMEEDGRGLEEGKTTLCDSEEKVFQIQSSSSKDSCVEVPKDLEDMPLVV